MKPRSKPLNVLYNGAHSNLRPETVIPQGGPSRFADNFRNYFLGKNDFRIVPFLFTSDSGAKKPFLKSHTISGKLFHELIYSNVAMKALYEESVTRASFLASVKPLLDIINETLKQEKIDVVFLNGFSVNNWLLLYAARTSGIPVVVQHAGIWKKEIGRKRGAYRAATRKLFYDMERDTVRLCAHHIFLNQFSMDVFQSLYPMKRACGTSSIVPLPIPIIGETKTFGVHSTSEVKIGMVGRWDSIKNHSAMLRLASAHNVPEGWTFHSVAAIPASSEIYEFPKKYRRSVTVHEPMSPEKLASFFASMDIVFTPSHFDVSPTVVAESLLAGTPVVISDKVGWQSEFSDCGLSDHIVSTNHSGAQYVKIIKKILADRKKNLKRYSDLTRYIKTIHGLNRVFDQYAKIFKEVSSRRD